MPAARRAGNEGRCIEWPWDDRGRSAVTRESVLADIERLRAWLEPRFFVLVRL